MGIGRLTLRLVIGGLFIGHGTQKLFGWFGGPGPAGTQRMMHGMQMHPPRAHAYAAGATETAGGALLAAGLATPAAAAGLTGVMLTAIRKVHLKNGVWVTQGGYEYNLTLIAALLSLAGDGPGELSLDRALKIERSGPAWALAALVVGAAASAAVIEAGRRVAVAQPSADAAVGQDGQEPEPAGSAAGQRA
jgi:putative oxidoreductase